MLKRYIRLGGKEWVWSKELSHCLFAARYILHFEGNIVKQFEKGKAILFTAETGIINHKGEHIKDATL